MKHLFRLAIAILILAVLIWFGDGLAAHWDVMSQLSLYALVLAVLALTAGRAVMAYKWLRLLRCRGAGMSLRVATQIYCAANVWGLFLPATIGSDTVRTICSCREGLNGHQVVASIMIERGIGFIVSAFLCVLGILYLAELATLSTTLYVTGWVAAILLFGLVLTLWLSFTETIYTMIHGGLLQRFADRKPVRLLRDLHNAYREYANHRRELLAFTGLTLLETILTTGALWVIAIGLGVDTTLVDVLAAAFLANLISRVPISIGGIGVFEAMFVLAMAVVGVSSTEALSIALLGQFLKILSWLPWWLAYTLKAGNFSAPTGKAVG